MNKQLLETIISKQVKKYLLEIGNYAWQSRFDLEDKLKEIADKLDLIYDPKDITSLNQKQIENFGFDSKTAEGYSVNLLNSDGSMVVRIYHVVDETNPKQVLNKMFIADEFGKAKMVYNEKFLWNDRTFEKYIGSLKESKLIKEQLELSINTLSNKVKEELTMIGMDKNEMRIGKENVYVQCTKSFDKEDIKLLAKLKTFSSLVHQPNGFQLIFKNK